MARFLIALSIIAIAVAFPFLFWGDQLDTVLTRNGAAQWLDEYGQFAWLAGIGLLISDLALPIPTTAVIAALGMVYGPILGGLVASVGSVVSGLIGYALCRHLGRPCALWLSGKRALATGERVFTKSGGWVVALSRWRTWRARQAYLFRTGQAYI